MTKLAAMRFRRRSALRRACWKRVFALCRFAEQSGVPDFAARAAQSIANDFGYAFWQTYDAENDVVRFCTSWATPSDMVDALLNSIPVK
ncbi:MAG: hypothetical protein R2912_11100 [Eubacteriales bacterium]